MLGNEKYFERMMLTSIITRFKDSQIDLTPETTKYISGLVANEYISEFEGRPTW